MTRRSARACALALAFALAGCGAETVKPESVLDTPEHHYSTGVRLLDKEEYDGAMKSFQRAVAMDPTFAPGHAGIGLIYGLKGNFQDAFTTLKEARGLQRGTMVMAQANAIRVLTMERQSDWLEDAESEFKDAQKRDASNPEPHFYMGKAYRVAFEFEKAAERFKTVLTLNKELTGEADREWKLVQKIQRAAPGTRIGKQIALVDKITRADVAALFIEELNLDRLYEKRGRAFDPSFKAPAVATMPADKAARKEPASDIAAHPLQADIDTVLKLGVRGLEASPERKFEPTKPITKSEYAVMLEDILIRITGDEKLATLYFGQKSVFPDVRPDLYFFNAAMVMTSRGILEADQATGEFGATQPVSGADALLAIRMFKEAMKI